MGRPEVKRQKRSLLLPIHRFEDTDDGGLIVYGRMTSEAIDDHGTYFPHEVITDAVAGWKWKNIREMHEPLAVGKAIEIIPDAEERCHWLKAKVSSAAPTTVQKVRENILQAFSLGGWTPEAYITPDKRDGVDCKRIGKLEITEVSLVDAPSNPDTAFSILRIQEETTMPDEMKDMEGIEKVAEPIEQTETYDAIMGALVTMKEQIGVVLEMLSGMMAAEAPAAEAGEEPEPTMRMMITRSAQSAIAAEKAAAESVKASEKLVTALSGVETRLAALEAQPVMSGAARHSVTRGLPGDTPGEEKLLRMLSDLPDNATIAEARAKAAFAMIRDQHQRGRKE